MATREIEEWTVINQIAEEFLDEEDDEEDHKNKNTNIEEVVPVVQDQTTAPAPKRMGADSSSLVDEDGVCRLDVVAFEWVQKQQQLQKKETDDEGLPAVTTITTTTTDTVTNLSDAKKDAAARDSLKGRHNKARAYALSGTTINKQEARKKQREEAKQTKIAARKKLFEPLTLEMVAKLSDAEKDAVRDWQYTYSYRDRQTAEEERRRRRAKDFERNKLKMRVITKMPKVEPTFNSISISNSISNSNNNSNQIAATYITSVNPEK